MPLLTQFASFFISPFGETSVCDDLNQFLKSHRIVNLEKKLIDGERGTGTKRTVFQYSSSTATPNRLLSDFAP